MKPESSHKIAHIKLEELRHQYEKLSQHYQNIEQKIQKNLSLEDTFKVLYQELKQIVFAQKKLHPDVTNLYTVQLEIDTGMISPGLLKPWVDFLQKELEQGKRRLDAALLFGLILEDISLTNQDQSKFPGKEGFEKSFIQLIQTPGKEPLLDFLEERLEDNYAVLIDIRNRLKKFTEKDIFLPVLPKEIKNHLQVISSTPYRHYTIRGEARQIVKDDSLIQECASTVTILLNNFTDWKWNSEGYSLKSTWTLNKWRPYHSSELLETLFLEVIGVRWGIELKKLLSPLIAEEKNDYGLDHERAWRKKELFLAGIPYSSEEYALQTDASGYTMGNGANTSLRLLQVINAEIETCRAQEYEGVYVVHTDLKDYILRISHSLLNVFLEILEVPQEWVNFFKTYFSFPYKYQNKSHTLQQGLPSNHILTTVIVDSLLAFLSPVIQEQGVQMYRFLDDIYLISPSAEKIQKSWNKFKGYCETFGFMINEEKTGAVVVDLPNKDDTFIQQFKQLPQWGFLELNVQGEWVIKQKAIGLFTNNLKKILESEKDIFSVVNIYNRHLNYLMAGLAPTIPLSEQHFIKVGQCLANFHKNLFAPQQGIFEEIQKRISQKFPELTENIHNLPEAWFYWAITGGGLGLSNPLCHIASLYTGYKKYEKIKPSTYYQQEDEKLKYFYNGLAFASIEASNPQPTATMQGWMNDFIQRGSEVSGRNQDELSAYWQWLLYTYGLQLLESFGTFRFLATELVPLQVIYQHLADDTEETS